MRSLFIVGGLLLSLVAPSVAAPPADSAPPNKVICCGELYRLVNPAGKKPTTEAGKALFQDLREWGEIVALKERLRQALQAIDDPNYDPHVLNLISTLTATMFHADGDAWDNLRSEAAKLQQLIEEMPRKPDSIRKTSQSLSDAMLRMQKPTYARLQALTSSHFADLGMSQESEADKKFLSEVADALQEMYQDVQPLVSSERNLLRAMRRFEGKRLSPRRAAFWLHGYRQVTEK